MNFKNIKNNLLADKNYKKSLNFLFLLKKETKIKFIEQIEPPKEQITNIEYSKIYFLIGFCYSKINNKNKKKSLFYYLKSIEINNQNIKNITTCFEGILKICEGELADELEGLQELEQEEDAFDDDLLDLLDDDDYTTDINNTKYEYNTTDELDVLNEYTTNNNNNPFKKTLQIIKYNLMHSKNKLPLLKTLLIINFNYYLLITILPTNLLLIDFIDFIINFINSKSSILLIKINNLIKNNQTKLIKQNLNDEIFNIYQNSLIEKSLNFINEFIIKRFVNNIVGEDFEKELTEEINEKISNLLKIIQYKLLTHLTTIIKFTDDKTLVIYYKLIIN